MITIILPNNNEFTRVYSSIEEVYKALTEARNLLSDYHIHKVLSHRQ